MNLFKLLPEGTVFKINPSEVNTMPELAKAFIISDEVKERIKADIQEHGLKKKPIHVFPWKGKLYVSDGHTRRLCCEELGLPYIWAEIHHFKTLEEALKDTVGEQVNRRNVTDADLLNSFEVLFKETTTNVSDVISKLGLKRRSAYKVMYVCEHATPEQLDSIRNSKNSFNQIYNQLHQNAEEDTEETVPVKDEAPYKTESAIESDETTAEPSKPKTKKITLSVNDAFLLGINYSLIESAKGTTSATILEKASSVNPESLNFTEDELNLLR